MAVVAGLLVWSGAGGCRDDASPTPRRALAKPLPAGQAPLSPDDGSSVRNPASPVDTVRRVNALRRAGRLGQMAQFVAQDRRRAVLELVAAVDQLILDNRVLQQRFQAAGRGAVGTLFDRSEVANIIGVFSMDLEVIKEEVAGDRAVVTIQVGQRLPLDRVSLELHEHRWTIQPDEPIPGLADELRRLGAALRRVGDAVSRQEMTVDQIAREMEFWQKPVMKRIRQLVEQAEHTNP
jgi:hypothetical protein